MATYSASQSDTRVPYLVSRVVFRHWGLIMLRGVAAIIFGGFALTRPILTLATLILIFGTYAIADGLVAIAAALVQEGVQHRWWLGIVGFIGVAVGIATFRAPGLTGALLLYYIAAWALAGGLLQIFGAIAIRKVITGEWVLIAGGILSVLFGITLFVKPGAGALAFITLIGMYAIVNGVLLMLFAMRMRSFQHRRGSPSAQRVA